MNHHQSCLKSKIGIFLMSTSCLICYGITLFGIYITSQNKSRKYAPAQRSSAQSIASPDGAKLYSLHFSVGLTLRHAEHFAGGGPFFCYFFLGKQKKVKSGRAKSNELLRFPHWCKVFFHLLLNHFKSFPACRYPLTLQ